jgi:hypothetical protein
VGSQLFPECVSGFHVRTTRLNYALDDGWLLSRTCVLATRFHNIYQLFLPHVNILRLYWPLPRAQVEESWNNSGVVVKGLGAKIKVGEHLK